MLHRIALVALASLFSLSYAPGCAPPHTERVTSTAPALTLGTTPEASALAACVCSTCAAVCADTCAPGMTEIVGAACKGCVVADDPDGCHTELDAYIATLPPPPASNCLADNPGATTCATGFTPAPLCDETITENCLADGDIVCPAGMVADVCCIDGATYASAVCVIPSAGSGGAGGSP